MKNKMILILEKSDVKIRDVDSKIHKQFVELAQKRHKTTGQLYNETIALFLSSQKKGGKKPSGHSVDKIIFATLFKQADLTEKTRLINRWLVEHNVGKRPEDADVLWDNNWRYVISQWESEHEYIDIVMSSKEMGEKEPEEKAKQYIKNVYIVLPNENFDEEFERQYVANPDIVVWIRERVSFGSSVRDLIVGRIEDFSAPAIVQIIEQYEQDIKNGKDYYGVKKELLPKLEGRKTFLENLAFKVANGLFGPLH